jgi:hypothetical protein
MNVNEFKVNIERRVKVCIDELSNNSSFFDPTKRRFEIRQNKGFETILFCNSAVIRIKNLKNGLTNLDLSKECIDLIKLHNRVRYTKSEVNWGKLVFNENTAKLIVDNIETVFKQCYMNESVDTFGCCSRYLACSDEKQCIHPDIKFAEGCMYKRHLDSGRIFYGKNRNADYITTDREYNDSADTTDFGTQGLFKFHS